MKSNRHIVQICRVGLFSALLALGAWISIPFTIPITMQTFVLFLMVGVLPMTEAILSVVIYLCIGLVGLPVFAGFSSGIGTLMGPTGGFLIGFFPFILFYGSLSKNVSIISLRIFMAIVSLCLLYCCGCIWYTLIYGGKGMITVCILPFLPADAIKLVLSLPLSKRLKKHLK